MSLHTQYQWESLAFPVFVPGALVSTSLPAETPTLLPRLAALIGELPNVYRSRDNSFTYFDSKLDFPNFTPPYDFVNTSASSIFDDVSVMSTSSRGSYYFSGNLMQDEFAPLRRFLDVGTWVRSLIGGRHITANLWLGSAGVRATAHYDAVYNVYAHIAGTKRIRLVAPRHAGQLGFYGRFHPHACQSRYSDLGSRVILRTPYRCMMNFEQSENSTQSQRNDTVCDVDYEGGPKVGPPFEVREFTLRAGDVLFIPPFWSHETLAETGSASISLWWDARVLDIMDELYRLPLPFESDWSDEVKWTATVTFMRRIAQSVVHFISQHQPALRCPTTEPVLNTAYLARLIRLRYPADWSCEDTSLFQCSDVPSNLVKADESCDGTCTEADKVSWHRQLEGREQDFKAVIVKLAPLLQRNQAGVCTGSNPPASCRSRMTNPVNDCAELRDQLAVLSIKLLDFIEDVFRQIIPEVHPARGLLELSDCFVRDA